MFRIAVRLAAGSDLVALSTLLGQLEETMERPASSAVVRPASSAVVRPASSAEDLIGSNVRALLDDRSARILVAEMDGLVVGMINFSMRRTALHPGPSALIDELVVDRNRRGQGIGRLLIDAALSEARLAGCCEIEVSTEKSHHGARRFYGNCGFDEDAVLLEKDL